MWYGRMARVRNIMVGTQTIRHTEKANVLQHIAPQQLCITMFMYYHGHILSDHNNCTVYQGQ